MITKHLSKVRVIGQEGLFKVVSSYRAPYNGPIMYCLERIMPLKKGQSGTIRGIFEQKEFKEVKGGFENDGKKG